MTPLPDAENTKPIAEQLVQLKVTLQSKHIDSHAVSTQLSALADKRSLLALETGSEGEMPSLIKGLASALRLAAGKAKPDRKQ